MKKPINLKRWLTLPEAARHFSTISDSEVSVDDLHHFALNKELTISVVFAGGAVASLCRPAGEPISRSGVKPTAAYSSFGYGSFGAIHCMSDGAKIEVAEETYRLGSDQAFDLTMMGSERDHVHRMYFKQKDQKPSFNHAIYLAAGEEILQLKAISEEDDAFRSTIIFPEDGVLVVTRAALQEFERMLNDDVVEKIEKPLAATERQSLLTIVGVVCDMAKIDVHKAAKAATRIVGHANLMGLSIGETTVEDHLKKVTHALDARKK